MTELQKTLTTMNDSLSTINQLLLKERLKKTDDSVETMVDHR